MKVAYIAQIIAVVPLALGAPHPSGSETTAAKGGRATWFHPALGACGWNHGDGDMITAVSHIRFDASRPCGKKIRVKGPAGEAVVTVVDRCTGCARDDLDLSPAAFKKVIGDLGKGHDQVSWDWA
jgi:hypothetical protein